MIQFDFYTLASVSSIMEQEENCGRLKDESYSQETKKISAEMKEKRIALRCASKSDKKKLYEELSNLIQHFNEQKEKEQRFLTEQIAKGKYHVIVESKVFNGKRVYSTADNESMVISKIISKEIAHYYRVKPADRNTIIEQLIAILDNSMPKIVIRADVKQFYESIPIDPLIDKLANDGYLAKRTMKYLRSFLFACGITNNNEIGIPRGLSFSAYLAEIYMGTIDKRIRQIPGIYFYKRYVDDIIIVANSQMMDVSEYWLELNKCFEGQSLELHNESEKKFISLFNEDSYNKQFEYLGYKFVYNNGALKVLLSDHRYSKYLITLNALFKIYSQCASYRRGKMTQKESDKRQDALQQLIKRIRVLTGNGLLSGRKNYVATGVYYTNKYITDTSQFEQLDNYLFQLIENKHTFCPPKALFNYSCNNGYELNFKLIKEKLHEYSFVDSFKNPRINKSREFSLILNALNRIYRKNEQVCSNIQIEI